MEVIAKNGPIYEVEADALVMAVFSGEKPAGELKVLDDRLEGLITKLMDEGEVSGKFREFTILHTPGIASKRVLLMGLGKREKFEADKIRSVAGRAARILRRINCLHIAFSSFTGLDLDPAVAAQCITEGTFLGLYHFKHHITTRKKKEPVKTIIVVAKSSDETEAIEKGAQKGKILAQATILARDLSNEPGNIINPTTFAQKALDVAKHKNLEIRIYDEEEMKSKGMGAIMAVSQGSDEPAKMIVMKYNGNPGGKTLGMVGKGITFDSGGLSIKPAESMYRMYDDCAGACAVLGAIQAVADMKLPVNVVAVMAMTENMPSGKAYRPGDIIKSYSGKTIEILNTDAEGRLALADALTLIQEEKCDHIVDIATLTGGCVTALGVIASGIMGNDQSFIDMLRDAGCDAGENLWQLPLYEDYFAQIHSDVADMQNSGGRSASACTAGKFLEQFIKKGQSWAHIDIAGTSMIERERTPYLKKSYLPKEGSTGVGVRTLYNAAEVLSGEGK